MITEDPPIQNMPGDGFITRVYREQPELIRRHLRRKYDAGVQLAFQYFECNATIRQGLQRLARWLRDDDEDTPVASQEAPGAIERQGAEAQGTSVAGC
jgi:hypothetical protein